MRVDSIGGGGGLGTQNAEPYIEVTLGQDWDEKALFACGLVRKFWLEASAQLPRSWSLYDLLW